MDVAAATRVLIVAAAVGLAVALLMIGPSSMPRWHRVGARRRGPGGHARVDGTNLMSYLAASMAVLLGGALAITR